LPDGREDLFRDAFAPKRAMSSAPSTARRFGVKKPASASGAANVSFGPISESPPLDDNQYRRKFKAE